MVYARHRIQRIVIGFIVLAVPLGCKQQNAASSIKIVGGEEMKKAADQRGMNATIALYLENAEGKATCTGTLIGPSHIVTAAHCLNAMRAIYVGWGPQFQGPQQAITVTQFTPHPKWIPGSAEGHVYDIGVISFKGALPPNMQPVALAAPQAVQSGTELLLVGYGLSTQLDDASAGILRQVKVLTDYVDTTKRFLSIQTNTRKGGCNGDSGGPAFIDNGGILQLVGATHGPSLGMEDVKCDEGHGIWSMVSLYQGWMKCTFAAHGNPLATLSDDASNVDCGAISTPATLPSSGTRPTTSQWCDPYKPEKCYSYCTNGSDTGGGFGYQAEVGGSCKVSEANVSNKAIITAATQAPLTNGVDKWCDPYKPEKCFPYCTNGSSTGGGFGYQAELGGSCKVR